MALLFRSRLFGLLLILASLPLDPGVALASRSALASGDQDAPPASEAMEARLRRIAEAVRERRGAAAEGAVAPPEDAVAGLFVNGGGPGLGIGWGNGGWPNGSFVNGWPNGGFRNGGWGNGGFRNGGWGNGGFRNGGFRNGGFRNGGFRNYW